MCSYEERRMPLVQITMLEGRSAEQKKCLMEEVTQTITNAIDVPAERVHVFIYDLPATDCGSAGIPAAQAMPVKREPSSSV